MLEVLKFGINLWMTSFVLIICNWYAKRITHIIISYAKLFATDWRVMRDAFGEII